ncbi:MAG: PEP-utilizing enzyme [Patescibacteria group bacterium]|nr:hypothetical protein [Patescibacteria group bacterium]
MEKLTKQVSGQVVFPGKARGRVTLYSADFKQARIPKGSIIVAQMTSPQIVEALENVSAIITDLGGLTCHAAIISREMKIPCIVGTGNATQIFKNNDRVKVDAYKGTVKLLRAHPASR